MMKRISLVTAILVSLNCVAQSYSVKWGELSKKNGRLVSVIPVLGSDFYALRWAGGIMLGAYRLAQYDNFVQSNSSKIEVKVEGGIGTFEDVRMINGKLMVFISDKKDKENHFFMQEYTKDMTPKGPSIELASYDIEKGMRQGFFNVIQSRDKEFFAVVWEIPGKKDKADKYGFKVFDNDMNKVSEGEYALPFESKYSEINQHYLSNTGDYFLSVTEYEKNESKGLFKTATNYKSLHIYHVTPDDLEGFELDLDGKRIQAYSMSSDNNHIFSIVGAYGEKGAFGISGLMNLQLDFDKKNIIYQGFEKFGKDFITQGWSDRQKKKADKKKTEPQFYEYVMRQSEVTKDGSVVGSLEQYYVREVSTYNASTKTWQTNYYYYYNDIIAFKINSDGKYDWLKKIPKYQTSVNDGGYFSSYERFVNDGKLCFIFNDHVKNYNESGDFIAKDFVYPANYSKKRNAVAIVEIDLKTGEVSRKKFFNREDVGAIAVPKQFTVNYLNNEMLIYTVKGKKEKFGLVTLKED